MIANAAFDLCRRAVGILWYAPAAMTQAWPDAPRLEAGGLTLGDEHVPLYSGAVHYFRLAPSDWAGALAGVRDLGLRIVDVYVPWAVHERAPGEFDFGQHDPKLDLPHFLRLAQDLGLYVYLRPGPHINAELTHFGIPQRVTLDPECQAHSSAGNPVPMIAPPQAFAAPSYASAKFAALTAEWYRAVGKAVRSLVWPAGPIALLQVDNEAAYYFRDGPFDQDYHPDAVAHYRTFLRGVYRDEEGVRSAYGHLATVLDECEPPRRFDGSSRAALRRQLDWAEAREALLEDALRRMRGDLAAAGLAHLPTLHNLSLGDAGAPAGIGRLQRAVDLVGLDFYECRNQLALVRRRALRMAGSTPLPFAPELGVGGPPWLNPRDRGDTLAVLLCCLAYGVRGFNFYMAVDRDRWYGAALSRSGTRTHVGRKLRALMRSLERVNFHRLKRHAQVGLMVPAEYARLARATHTLGFLSPLVMAMTDAGPTAACRQDPLGFARAIQIDFDLWLRAAEEALDRAGVPYVYIDSACPESVWASLDTVLTPTYEFAEPSRMRALAAFEARGGKVISGPGIPRLDHHLREVPGLPELKGPKLDLVEDTEVQLLPLLPAACQQPRSFRSDRLRVHTSLHEDAEGIRVVFVTNFAGTTQRARIALPGPVNLTDAIDDTRYAGEDDFAITLPPYECRMLVVERPRPSRLRPSARRDPTATAGGSHD